MTRADVEQGTGVRRRLLARTALVLTVLVLSTVGLSTVGLAVPAWAGPPAAAAQPTPPPEGRGFAIAVDDRVTSVKPGDRLSYEVTLRNTTQAAATANIELTVPVGAAAVDLGNGGRAPEPWYVQWTLQVPAGASVVASAAFVAGPPVGDTGGYPASACLVENFARLICATDVDQVVGGADPGAASTGDGAGGLHGGWLLPAGAVALVLLVVAVGWWWHRRWVADDSGTPETAVVPERRPDDQDWWPGVS